VEQRQEQIEHRQILLLNVFADLDAERRLPAVPAPAHPVSAQVIQFPSVRTGGAA
jgi:hypothetical protein